MQLQKEETPTQLRSPVRLLSHSRSEALPWTRPRRLQRCCGDRHSIRHSIRRSIHRSSIRGS